MPKQLRGPEPNGNHENAGGGKQHGAYRVYMRQGVEREASGKICGIVPVPVRDIAVGEFVENDRKKQYRKL